jgi:hypothetical protein
MRLVLTQSPAKNSGSLFFAARLNSYDILFKVVIIGVLSNRIFKKLRGCTETISITAIPDMEIMPYKGRMGQIKNYIGNCCFNYY